MNGKHQSGLGNILSLVRVWLCKAIISRQQAKNVTLPGSWYGRDAMLTDNRI